MAVTPRVVLKRRSAITELPLYHSGHLMKKNSNQDFRTCYTELRGTTLFLYDNNTQDTYTERMDLEKVTFSDLEDHHKRTVPTCFTLNLQKEEVQFRAESIEAGVEWKSYILTVIQKEVPKKLSLLPGQIIHLEDVLTQEKKRSSQIERPPLPPRPTLPSKDELDQKAPEMPDCFFDVNREEAEKMLRTNPEYGNLILRPSTRANNYAVTYRQIKPNGDEIMKHFRVSSTKAGFFIEMEKPVTVPSLKAVVNYFLERTEYRLQPYRIVHPYDTRLDISKDLKNIGITTAAAPKQVPKAQVPPMPRQEKPPLPKTKPPENEYLMPDESKPDKHSMKKVDIADELRAALKQRRGAFNVSENKVEGKVNENRYEKSAPRKTTWDKKSSEA